LLVCVPALRARKDPHNSGQRTFDCSARQATQLMDHAAVKLVVVARHRLDGDALAALIGSHQGFEVLCSTTSVDHALSTCRRRQPQVIILDATLVNRENGYDVAAFLPPGREAAVLLLDETPNRRRLSCALKLPVVGYFTRGVSGKDLVEAIGQLAAGRSAFDVSIGDVVQQTSDGWRLRDRQHSPLSKLTVRELEVLRLIALGNTVRACAEKLQLAPSTVDNHKSRLMRKLGLHRTAELVRFAVREGVIGE
jgi:DNA-binding NarL/FixJ family response regulator